jgi:hypothetical protein
MNATQEPGTGVAVIQWQQEKETKMFTGMQIILGFVVGAIGFLQIAENPGLGCSALLLSGFMIMAGIDHLSDVNK